MGSTRSFPALGFDPAPGDVGTVNDYVTALNSSSGRISDARNAMSALDVGDSWTGPAAEGFQHHVGKLGTNMAAVHGAVTGAGKVLDEWSTELGSMQSQADDLESRAAQAQQQLRTAQSNPDLNLAGQTFTDQTSALAAQQRYQSATGQVRAAQGQVDSIREQGRQLYQKHQQLAQGYAGALTNQLTGGGSTGLSSFGGSVSGGGALLDGRGGGTTQLGGGFSATGSAQGSLLGADGKAGFHVGQDGFSASATGEAYLADGSVQGSINGPFGTGLSGSAAGFVGASGNASAFGGPDGAGMDLGGFAGAEGELQGSVAAGGATGSVGVDGWAGVKGDQNFFVGTDQQGDTGFSVGADAEAGAGVDVTNSVSGGGVGVSMTGGTGVGIGAGGGAHAYVDPDGTYHVGFNAGGDFIAGADVGLDVSVNPQQVESTADTVGSDIEQGADTVGGYVESGAKTVAAGIESLF